MNIILKRHSEKKHSVLYKNDETGTNAYVSKEDLPKPFPNELTISLVAVETVRAAS